MKVYPISIKHAICYLVKVSDFYIAIDAGWAGHINEYLKMMHKYGINQDKIKYLFVTHFHPDHEGLVENIKRFGTTFVGDLYRQNLVMEDDFKSRESWELLKKSGAKRIYFAHGEENRH